MDVFVSIYSFLRFGILNSGWDDSLNDMPWEMSCGFLNLNEKWIEKMVIQK